MPFIFFALAIVVACAGPQEEKPVIGDGTDEYKASPCACVEIPQDNSPEYLQRLHDRLGLG